MAARAGASARREYRRRRRRARVVRWGLLLVAVTFVVRVPAVTALPSRGPWLPVVLGVGAALAWAARRGRRSAEAWRVGAEGEQLTADRLRRLERKGFVVLHDRRLPGTRANVDHVAVGSRGVFTIETKHYGGEVRLRRSLLSGSVNATHDRRSLDGVVAQARHQADAVRRVLVAARVPGAATVQPVVVVHRAALRVGRFSRPVTAGVRWCAPDRVVRTLGRGRRVLSGRDVRAVAALLDDRLAPAATSRRWPARE